jgi:hypothetical protein
LGPIISRLFTCSNEEKIKKRVLALVLSLWHREIQHEGLICDTQHKKYKFGQTFAYRRKPAPSFQIKEMTYVLFTLQSSNPYLNTVHFLNTRAD